jgi:transcriptional regulator with XRE-family HTH domain
MAPTYGAILAANIRGIRNRKGLGQEALAKRMRGLGHEWVRQTVGATERGRRRVLVEEVVALAAALETTALALMVPTRDDKVVELAGEPLEGKSVEALISGLNDGAIRWKDDEPVFSTGKRAWFQGDPDAPDAVKAAWAGEGRSVDEILHKAAEDED